MSWRRRSRSDWGRLGMKSNWEAVPLGDVCAIKNGYAFKSKDFSPCGIPVIKIKNVKPNQIVINDFSYVPEAIADEKSKWLINKDEILLTMTGNRADGSPESWVGKAARFTLDGKYLLNQRVAAIKSSSDKLDTEYLGYYLSSWESQLYFIKHSNSSGGQANISPTVVKEYGILLPPIAEQKQIVSILRSLDDKIELNNKINENLEQQAQAIFKSWFVNFEPFHNGSVVKSELGTIPEGWRAGTLSELVTVKYGKDHKKLADGKYPVYGSGGIMRYVERPLYTKESVLIPRKGTLNNVLYVNEPFWSVDTMFYTEMKIPNAAKFVYHFISGKDLASMNAGSAVPSMTTDILNAFELVIPPDNVLAEFERTVSSMYKAMAVNCAQSRNLARMRDTLLPKLMNGEIEINGI